MTLLKVIPTVGSYLGFSRAVSPKLSKTMVSAKATECMVLLIGCVLVLQVTAQLTRSEKQNILDAHNRLRGQVSPTASNMAKMVS